MTKDERNKADQDFITKEAKRLKEEKEKRDARRNETRNSRR